MVSGGGRVIQHRNKRIRFSLQRRGIKFVGFVVVIMECGACGTLPGIPLSNEATDPINEDAYELLARFVHISDAQIVDEESPARLATAADFTLSAWRPYEAYSSQLLDGTIRTINKLHVADSPIDFVVHTGDATDNAQLNELRWFVDVFDGGEIDPLSGVDDRESGTLPDPLLDPHHTFIAQGLYRNGVHGDAPTIAWYTIIGNHDRFGVGVFPIVTDLLGRRVSPLPIEERFGLLLPAALDPIGYRSWGPISPAHPGPPPRLNLPTTIQANPDRRYITDEDFVTAHLDSATIPAGHGLDRDHPARTWYSVSPVPGVRLIGLNSATPLVEQPGLAYSEGSISWAQVVFLRAELAVAQSNGETVIVATHHPSDSLEPVYGSALSPQLFRGMLNEFDSVALHIAGHWHEHATFDQGGYVEMVTSSIIDAPQEGRVIEIWREREGGLGGSRHTLRYSTFSHLDAIDPPDDSHAALFADPLLDLRRTAAELAGVMR